MYYTHRPSDALINDSDLARELKPFFPTFQANRSPSHSGAYK